MALKIIVSNTVGIKVAGVINDEAGKPEPFDFRLTCRRQDVKTIKDMVSDDGDMVDFLEKVIIDWSGIKGEDGSPMPYTPEALRRLCAMPGIANLAYQTYLIETGARAKN